MGQCQMKDQSGIAHLGQEVSHINVWPDFYHSQSECGRLVRGTSRPQHVLYHLIHLQAGVGEGLISLIFLLTYFF